VIAQKIEHSRPISPEERLNNVHAARLLDRRNHKQKDNPKYKIKNLNLVVSSKPITQASNDNTIRSKNKSLKNLIDKASISKIDDNTFDTRR
jgi:hypothetical protein